MIGEIIQLYAAIWLVVLLHELGHFPERIKFNKGFLPTAAAMNARSRYGGLAMNALIFLGIYYMQPEALFLQLLGLVAWAHFVLYAFFGSIMPETDPTKVNTATYVFDDVPNKYWYIFIPLALLALYYLKDYYLSVLGVFF
jgi:hypothetical protein